ncbi:MAG TPA: cation:proton antiporter, partial [Candidatus Baltobacteraceae bacterium]|nr:cation:proton antiporter [Candidatus Baltobacteraceae bacterium]
MEQSLLLPLALSTIIMLALLARRLELPYPIVFVVGGTLLAFVPHAPLIVLQPEWVFALILPPLLFSGGWSTDWKLFRTNLRPI